MQRELTRIAVPCRIRQPVRLAVLAGPARLAVGLLHPVGQVVEGTVWTGVLGGIPGVRRTVKTCNGGGKTVKKGNCVFSCGKGVTNCTTI